MAKLEERPITRDDCEALIAQIRRAIESGVDEAAVRFVSRDLLLEKSPDGGFTLRAPDQTVASRVFLEVASRPPGYPGHVPFAPNEVVTVSEESDGVSLTWWVPRDPNGLFAGLSQECLSGGWVLKGQYDTDEMPVHQRSYERDGVRRHLLSSFGMVSLLQRKWQDRPMACSTKGTEPRTP
jgi:hypothetical protein